MNTRPAWSLVVGLVLAATVPLHAQSTRNRTPARKPPARGAAPPSRAALDSAYVAGVLTGASIQGARGPVIYYVVAGGTNYGGAYAELPNGYVQQAPPPSNIDVRGPQPGPALAWIPGRWVWNGASFSWYDGRWVPIPGGYTAWVPGRWDHNQLGHYWVPGEWR